MLNRMQHKILIATIAYEFLYHNQINVHALIGQSALVIKSFSSKLGDFVRYFVPQQESLHIFN